MIGEPIVDETPNLDYERDVKIDDQSLDVEWLNQPILMKKYAIHAADTKRAVDDLKERLEVCRARLDMAIRSDPVVYGVKDKPTEGAIASAILLQEEYQKLSRKCIDARYENDVAQAVVRAIDQRKTALENLVRLLAASYFAGPQSPRNLSRERLAHEQQKQVDSKVRIQRIRKSVS